MKTGVDPNRKKSVSAIVIRWLARAWSIPAILFVGAHLFSPGTDSGVEVHWFTWLTVGVLFLSVFSLAFAWWQEWIGGWMSLGFLGLFFIVYGIDNGEFFPVWWLLLAAVAVPAGLFLVSNKLRTSLGKGERA